MWGIREWVEWTAIHNANGEEEALRGVKELRKNQIERKKMDL